MDEKLHMPAAELNAFCKRWKVRELSIFGSALRDDFGPDSDVDILIRFFEDVAWGVFELIDMKEELQTLFGRRVDLVEEGSLRNPFRKKAILHGKKVIYAAA